MACVSKEYEIETMVQEQRLQPKMKFLSGCNIII